MFPTLVTVQILVLIVLLLGSAFFSSAESALFSLNPIQLRRMEALHPAATARVNRLLSTPTRLLATILIGNTLVNVLASSIGFVLAEEFAPSRGEVIAVPGMTLLLLVFGEIGPKRIAMFWPERVSLAYAPLLPPVTTLFAPLHWMLSGLTRQIEHLFHRNTQGLTEAELETVVHLSGEEGVIEAAEGAMVRAIMGLEDLRARDVMSARVDIVGIDLNDPPADCVALAQNAGVRFLPLYTEDLDHIEGFLHVARFLLDPDKVLAHAWVTPFYVPETATLDRVLTQFQREGRRVAVVVDEYGGTSGMITRGDILEEMVGAVDDDFVEQKELFDETGPGRWLVDGNMSLEEVNERTGLPLEAADATRLAGWVAEQAERLPHPGESVHAQGCIATVKEMRRNRIILVELAREKEPGS